MLSSRPLAISIALFVASPGVGLAREQPATSAKSACPSIDARVMRILNEDQKLAALGLEGMPCETLQKLAAILKGSIPEPAKKVAPTAASQVSETRLANAKITTDKPADNGPQHGTAEFAQENAPRLYVRQSALDSFYYLYPAVPSSNAAGAASKALGASVSYTNDEIARTQVASIQAYTAYVVARNLAIFPPDSYTGPYVSKWAIAPWLSAAGTLNEPPSPKEKSALQFGADGQFEVSGLGPFDIQDFRAAPYLQTDFRGLGHIAGFDVLWEPYNLGVLLGGADHAVLNDFMFFYWRLNAESDIKHVESAGLSNLVAHRDYAWLGGTLQAKMFLFPNSPNPNLAGRIYLSESYQFFDNAASSQRIEQFISEIGYNLSSDGSSSISLQYTNGTDKATLVTSRQYKAQFNYKM
jgi:hypothetical protein